MAGKIKCRLLSPVLWSSNCANANSQENGGCLHCQHCDCVFVSWLVTRRSSFQSKIIFKNIVIVKLTGFKRSKWTSYQTKAHPDALVTIAYLYSWSKSTSNLCSHRFWEFNQSFNFQQKLSSKSLFCHCSSC